MLRARTLAFAFVVLGTLATPAMALGQDREGRDLTEDEVARARNHFEAGRAYYDDGRYEDAVRELSEAHRITGHPDILYNLGQAYDRLDRHDEAIEAYRGYLAQAEDAPDRARVERRIEELEELLEAEARARRAETRDDASALHGSDARGGFGPWPWVALGSAGALAVGAAITGGLAFGTYGDLDEACGSDRVCPPDRQDDIEAGETLATVSSVLTLAAVVAAGVGVVLFVLDDDGEDAPASAVVEVAPGPAPVGATARVRF